MSLQLERGPRRFRTWIVYVAMLAATVLVFMWIDARGQGLQAPEPVGTALFGQTGGAAKAETLAHVLVALVVILVFARGVGHLFRRLHQPPVIGEVIAGILLGPSALGRFAPELSNAIFPATVTPYI